MTDPTDATDKNPLIVFGDLDRLMDKVDSKFTLVNVVTKRATNRINANKPVSTAFNEVAEGKIGYKRTREGIK